ncbi:MAG: PQQ-like beta-propeller repeat protein [Verrucomicrobia bacterium]|nr:PQQ-like beta-propeller repeat protein [Verrucomicrobiota bacterium]
MNKTNCLPSRAAAALAVAVIFSSFAAGFSTQGWPQWRGANGAARAADFKVPKTWPKELTQKWKVTVGEGVATPALVGDRLYVFTRQDGGEVIRCLNASTGKELWLDKYDSLGATGPAQSFSGPRSSPAVADGKVVTVGVRGMLSCLDAATGRLLWRRDDFQAWPNFFVSSSPLILDGTVVAQLGGRENGALVAYDLATGNEKWRWRSGNPSYASPAVATVDGVKLIVVQTEARLAAVNAADGRVVWEGDRGTPPDSPGGRGGRGGGGRDYKATTPAADGPVVFITGRANKAIRFEKSAEGFKANQLWSNEEKASQFASPVVKEGTLFGLSAANELFALDAQNGNLLWSAGITAASQLAVAPPESRGDGGPARPEGPGGRGGAGGGRMGGGSGYGSVVDAGTVLLALTPSAELVAFEPSRDAFKEVARLRVANSPTHAYPVPAGNRIFVKDRDSVILWTVE